MIDWRSSLIIMPRQSLPPLSKAQLKKILPYQDEILDALRHCEAPLSENSSCHMCNSPAEYRCGSCFFNEEVCKRCLLSHHEKLPLHNQVQVRFQFALLVADTDVPRNGTAAPSKTQLWLPLASSFSSDGTKATRVPLHPTPKIL